MPLIESVNTQNAQAAIYRAISAIFTRAPIESPAAWAAKNRVYPETAGLPGPRDPWLTPYMVPFTNALHARDGRYRRAVAVCAAQTGKTDGVLDVIGARLDQRPAPMLYVGPTQDFVKDQFEPRIMALLDEAETLSAKVARGKRMRKTLKQIAGVRLRLAHGGSSAALKSDPAALALVDEYDEMLANVGGQGDVLGLVEARGETYADFIAGIISTCSKGLVVTQHDEFADLEFWGVADPEDLESPIWMLWQQGTRHHWTWPCPQCDLFFIPRFDRLRWQKGATPAQAKADAWIECPHCGGVITENDKAWMNERGAMVAPGERVDLIDDQPHVTGNPRECSTVSYWTSGLCSPFVTFGQRAETYLTAHETGDHDRIQTAMNAAFGECYAMTGSGEMPEWEEVLSHRLPYARGTVPDGVLRMVIGVDVQKMSLYFVIRGFGARGKSWLIDWGQLHGPTDRDDVWSALDDVVLSQYDGWTIEKGLVDSGFRPNKKQRGSEHRVYAYCHRMQWIFTAAKGHATQARPYRISRIEVDRDGQAAKKSVHLAHLDSDYFKSLVMNSIKLEMDQPGAWYLPQEADEEYARQVVSETRVIVNGKPQWLRKSKDNHYLDCEALAAAAAFALNVNRIPDESEGQPAAGGHAGQASASGPADAGQPVETSRPSAAGNTDLRDRFRRIGGSLNRRPR